MSLIYSALNKLEQDRDAPVAPDHAIGSKRHATARPGVPRWVYLLVLGGVVLVLSGWLALDTLKSMFSATQVPAAASKPTPAVVAVLVPVTTVAVAPDLPVPVQAELPVMTPTQVLPAFTATTVAEPPTASPTVVVKVVAAPPRAQARPRPPVEISTEAAPPPTLDPQETEQLIKAVTLAIQAGRQGEAQNLLKQLAVRLPSESITLLRLNAWHSMQGGDPARAMALYRQIVERMPDDESAGINLALLHWKAGQTDEARRLMGSLAERHPESNTVQKYNRELGAPR